MRRRARIARVAVAHPEDRVCQGDIPALMGLRGLSALRARALVRGAKIAERRIVVSADEIRGLTTIARRNAVYHDHAAPLAARAALPVLPPDGDSMRVGALVTSSCTGYSVPSIAVELVGRLGLCPDVMRLPITEAGCAGGVVALARAADYVDAHPGEAVLALAVELCSLSFHHSDDEGVLTANLIFGDGAGAAWLESGDGRGLEIVDSASMLVPGTRGLLGFDLTDQGFYPVLSRELVTMLPGATAEAATRMLSRHGLTASDVGAWLLHPGGSRILAGVERALGLSRRETCWSWDSLREFGNTSSAAIFDVLSRYLDAPRPAEWAVVAAFGPGVAIELLLVRRAC